jgi:pimeloyl-ACP methyl ester carboxylesterase
MLDLLCAEPCNKVAVPGGGVKLAERMIEANGVKLCTEPFGDPADPPILLIMGIGGSMLWWEEGFCRMLADGGRFVIRTTIRCSRSSTARPWPRRFPMRA